MSGKARSRYKQFLREGIRLVVSTVIKKELLGNKLAIIGCVYCWVFKLWIYKVCGMSWEDGAFIHSYYPVCLRNVVLVICYQLNLPGTLSRYWRFDRAVTDMLFTWLPVGVIGCQMQPSVTCSI